MAYQSQTGDSMYTSSNTLSDSTSRHSNISHQHSHSANEYQLRDSSHSLVSNSADNLPPGQNNVRHSYPISQWGASDGGSSLGDLSYTSLSSSMRGDQSQTRGYAYHQSRPQPKVLLPLGTYRSVLYDAQCPNMASNVTCNIQGKSKYSFGLFFPPKSTSTMTGSSSGSSSRTISAESLSRGYDEPNSQGLAKSQTYEVGQQRPVVTYRKTSLDESSALTSSAKSREFFIRYSSDKAASDHRNRYSPRHSAYERYSTDNRPTYIISRSQTVSAISPTQTGSTGGNSSSDYLKASNQTSNEGSPDTNRSRQYIPVLSESKLTTSSDNIDKRGAGVSMYNRSSGFTNQSDPATGSRTFVVRIPYEQHKQASPRAPDSSLIPLRQSYGTTFALTRSPNTTHIEIQKSIGKPIVSQRKFQFETGKNENTPPPGTGGHNRYKTEIEKIRTQPKFSSIAMRKASFEQSPERDPPGMDDPIEVATQPDYMGSSVETAQPTVKVRKISSERYTSGSPRQMTDGSDRTGNYQDAIPIRIYMSSGGSSPHLDLYAGDGTKPRHSHEVNHTVGFTSSPHSYEHSTSPSNLSVSSGSVGGPTVSESSTGGGLADSGVWLKSYHSSSDMLDGVEGSSQGGGDGAMYSLDAAADQEVSNMRLTKPARKGSYLSAVNASYHSSPKSESPSAVESRSSYIQPPQQSLAESQCLPYPSQSSSILHAPSSPQPRLFVPTKGYPSDSQSFSSMGSTHSLSSVSSGSLPVASVAPSVMSSSDSCLGMSDESHLSQNTTSYTNLRNQSLSVTMRKKLPEPVEDQANKLHRRTSYLMATARDRTNVVPIEKAFSTPPQLVTDHRPQQQGSMRHQNSIKLNKFFGEMIPEGVEQKPAEKEEVPEVIRKGHLACKISVIEGKKCSDRSWKQVYAVLRQTELYLTRDKENCSSFPEDQHIPIKSCMVEPARDYAKKKKHVFRMTTYNECEYLFQTEDRGTMLSWIQAIKSINEPEKAEKMEEMIASEREKTAQSAIEANASSSKMSPQMGHKGRKLSALSFKAKLSSSPSMRRKKSGTNEKEKGLGFFEESFKKGWKGRLPMMKSLKKHSEESSLSALSEQDVDTDKMQFGVHLEDCFPSPHNEFVPLIVELCTRIVEARGLEVVGVYRVPGNSAAVNALTEEFNRGIDSVNIDNEKLLDINVISSLLKSFFRKLPEPLIPPDMYDQFIEANRYPDEDKRKLKIKRLLHLLPPHNNETLKHMAEHLNKVASYGNINKMDAKNLAIMFGPTLVRKKGDDTVSLVTDMSDQCRIVESIILHHDWFFSPWDQDNYIPMETTVETVSVEDGQSLLKDDDEEADSAISAKQIISSIVGAASKKLRSQQGKSTESLDMIDSCSMTTTSSATYTLDDTLHSSSRTKSLSSIASSRSASEEFLERKSANSANRYLATAPIANSEPDFMDFEYADATSPSSSFSRHFSDDSLVDKNDELEISHGLPTSLSRDAIHNTLKRIGNDVSALLHTFEQKQLKERERRRWEQEMIEREHMRTQLELEQEENHSVEDWLAWKGISASRMPDLVSSSYLGQTYPYEESRFNHNVPGGGEKKDKLDMKRSNVVSLTTTLNVPPVVIPPLGLPTQPAKIPRVGSHEDILSQPKNQRYDAGRPVMMRGPSQRRIQENQQRTLHVAVGPERTSQRPSSIRHSFGRRHGSLDSLIDMIDRQDKRASWASSDSEDGSDLLNSITTTFDQKLQILLNPKYKLTGAVGKSDKMDSLNNSSNSNEDSKEDNSKLTEAGKARILSSVQQPRPGASLLDSERPFRDPSLHRSAKSDPKIGIASRFERHDCGRASSASPVTTVLYENSNLANQKKCQLPDFRAFLSKPPAQPPEPGSVTLTQPKKLDTSPKSRENFRPEQRTISKSEKTEMNLARLSRDETSFAGEGVASLTDKQDNKENRKIHKRRRHTVGGMEDFDHINAISRACADLTSFHRPSAWERLQPAVKDPGSPGHRNMQTWIQRERVRGSTPDLTCQDKY
ncbi:unnamed protein product [Lymnaea stagnalis]|uniref:Rho GTPase-activating protein 21 n=1 Tax=Lymnaea stagnalis TaxID=6523 RepID=A0AAV2H4W9_LYMST